MIYFAGVFEIFHILFKNFDISTHLLYWLGIASFIISFSRGNVSFALCLILTGREDCRSGSGNDPGIVVVGCEGVGVVVGCCIMGL